MINTTLSVTPMCHKCANFEPMLNHDKVYADGTVVEQNVKIACCHTDICANAISLAIEEVRGEKENG